jgi:large subunit ribosomal protein L16
MLMPKRVKYRKPHHRSIARGVATACNTVAFGDYGLQSLEHGKLTAKQIEAARVVARRTIGSLPNLYIRIFPHMTLTSRPADTRMGKGKGEVTHWIAVVKPGTVLFEVSGVDEKVAREACRKQAHKLPVKTRFVKKRLFNEG